MFVGLQGGSPRCLTCMYRLNPFATLRPLEIIEQFKLQSKVVGITASTGLAACNIGGLTLHSAEYIGNESSWTRVPALIHSFAGIGLGDASIDDLIKAVGKKKKVMERWKKTEVLIIDESESVIYHSPRQLFSRHGANNTLGGDNFGSDAFFLIVRNHRKPVR
ncbi:hypothetical protein BC938DRAFT_475126 [Jimgerdemannia flammicorona]|uniref:DNA helicase n=1 Tax=Jimgerdemannia flammicorona TaxID=994334 RepID=A0A433QRZ0_9FUNG|nr:hypothetical protein BC938DRAFT_475126 [Jimgerdemannia flammicorona]